MKLNKDLGQVFTPEWIVRRMLDNISFSGKEILNKKILEPSAGDGSFIKEIVRRIILEGIHNELNKSEIKEILENNVYAFEIDSVLHEKLIQNADEIALEFGIENISWRFVLGNSFYLYTNYADFFDYIVGNPPYIRVHSIPQAEREYIRNEFELCKEGTMDTYFIFFEIAMYMAKENGYISYITPNTFMRTKTGERLRKWMLNSKSLLSLIDFKGLQIFQESTFTVVSTLQKNSNLDSFAVFDGEKDFKELPSISIEEARSRAWDFYSIEDNQFLSSQLEGERKVSDLFEVQCAICTLRDKLYIRPVEDWDEREETAFFNGHWIEKGILHKVEKATKYNGDRTNLYILFPYQIEGEKYEPFEETFFQENFPLAYNYLLSHKDDLLTRDMDSKQHWYIFGRSQGIKNSKKDKVVFKNIVKNNLEKLEIHIVPADTYIYSGIYIVGENLELLKEILESRDFAKYLSLRGLNKAGGYKEINTKMIKNFCIDSFLNKEESI